MGSVSRATTSKGEKRYRARYRDPAGNQREKWFDRKIDAERWLTTVEHSKLRGDYLDPTAGKVLFGDFAWKWFAAQTADPSTLENIETRLRLHLEPPFGEMELRAIRPSTVQAWLRGRQQDHAPTYVRVMLSLLSSILAAAVDDGLITRNPCAAKSVRPPKLDLKKVVPWPAEQVQAVIDAHPDHLRAVPVLAAGAGLRQGEALGLRVEDVDFLRRQIHVRQQVKIVSAKVLIAPPKGGKIRTVPLADVVGFELAEHIRRHSPTSLLFPGRGGAPLNRNAYNRTWHKALRAASVTPGRDNNGLHQLPLLRIGPARRRRVDPGGRRVPRPQRPRVHLADLHAPHADLRRPSPPGCRCGVSWG